ncbi:acyl carrier protein [Streptomyces sp. NPDC054786]
MPASPGIVHVHGSPQLMTKTVAYSSPPAITSSSQLATPHTLKGGPMMWDGQFEEILRSYLPFLAGDERLTEETDLRDLGLDSLGVVDLLARLEQHYDVRFVDDALTMDNFATPGRLWGVLQKVSDKAA